MLRAERGVARREFSETLDVHYQTIGYLERGEYSLFVALVIAQYFGMLVPVEVVLSTKPLARLGSEQLEG